MQFSEAVVADTVADTVEVAGTVERVVFRAIDTGWSVLSITPHDKTFADKKSGRLVVTGITAAGEGTQIVAVGTWEDRKGERQLKATRIDVPIPTSPKGIEAFLSSGIIAGIGPKKAKQIVAHFGAKTIQVLDEEPERLAEIKGFGKRSIDRIAKRWAEQKMVRAILLFLHDNGIAPSLCKRIYAAWGEQSIERLKTNPYALATEVRGIGFATADRIARDIGIDPCSPNRALAALVHVAGERASNGHTVTPCDLLVQNAAELLATQEIPEVFDMVGLVRETLRRAIENPGKRPVLAERDGLIGLAKLISQEEFIADRLMSMIGTPPWGRRKDLEAVVKEAEEDVGMSLATQQRAAVLMALSHRVSIMTGGPGVGKTATTRVILSALKAIKCRVVLAAPTGKAAKRASEATGHPASTIHRLLGMVGKPSDDGADEPKPEHIDADVVVVDEMSMTDVPLMTQIVAAIGPKTALLMIGDVDQLPSVGPGRVLQDLIDSGRVPVTRLTEVFRQAAGSYIITNAHRINTGQMPVAGGPGSDFFVLDDRNVGALREASDLSAGDVAKVAANLVLDLVCDRLPSKYGFDPVRDIQVLTPMRKGDAGVQALNEALQRRLLPEGLPFVARGFNRFHVGDKVIQTRNNYDIEIFNGDMGIVLKVDHEEDEVVVEIDGRQVLLEGSALDDLQLAYAMTIHKSQGSQAPAVVIPMLTQHWMMLKRNLIYTGVTRAQKLAVLVGQNKAIAAAVRTKDSSLRLTRLEHLLKAAA